MRLLVPVLLCTLAVAGEEQQPPSSPTQSPTMTQQTSPAAPSSSSTEPVAAQKTAQTQVSPSPTTPILRVTTRLVLVDVVVTDNSGRPVTDLKQNDFDVRENGKPQKIVAFTFQPPPNLGNSGYKP